MVALQTHALTVVACKLVQLIVRMGAIDGLYTGTNIDCFPADKANAACSSIVRMRFRGIAGWLRSCTRQVSKFDLASMAPGAAALVSGMALTGAVAGRASWRRRCEVAPEWVSTLSQPGEPECDSGELSLR